MKVKTFGQIIYDGEKLRFDSFHFESSYPDEPVTHAGMVKAVCEFLNSTLRDESFIPLKNVLTGKQL